MGKAAQPARLFRLLGKMLFGVLLGCCITTAACPQGDAGRPKYDVNPRRVDLIPAGTVIEKGPPKGWSHLVLKSHPRAAAGDYERIAPVAVQNAGLLFTGIVANVHPDRPGGQARHRLAGLAVGMGTRIGEKDTIITPETQRKLGANLGFIGRTVLSRAYEKLQDLQLVARSDTMAVLDAPNVMVREGKHKRVLLRYAVLVDAATGQLDTLLWVIDRDDKGALKAAGPAQWLPPGKTEDLVLHVDAREFSFGVPSEIAFAIDKMIKGDKEVELADALVGPAGKARLTAEQAAELEAGLRAAMQKASK